jgi:hypothetical protein
MIEGLRTGNVINRQADRREELRKRRDVIIRELCGPRKLTDEQVLELRQEMRKIQAKLGERTEGVA